MQTASLLLQTAKGSKAIALAIGKTLVVATGTTSHKFEAPDSVRCLSIAEDVANPSEVVRFAVALDDKKLSTYEVPATSDEAIAEPLSTRNLEKRATALTRMSLRTSNGAEPVLIAADKFGDCFAFRDPQVDSAKRWLLSHTGTLVSALTSSLDSRFLISADREEKIRISHFPSTFDIQSFCLGHTRFVTAVSVLRQKVLLESSSDLLSATDSAAGFAEGELLVSAGADGTLRLWHWASGTVLHSLYLSFDASSVSGEPEGKESDGVSFDSTDPRYRSVASESGHSDGAVNSSEADRGEDKSSEVGIPKAWSESADKTGAAASTIVAPLLPGDIEECLSTGLLATVIDGERCIRLLEVSHSAGSNKRWIAVPRSHDAAEPLHKLCSPSLAAALVGHPSNSFNTGSAEKDSSVMRYLPQARLSQIGVLKTPFRPLAYRFLAAPLVPASGAAFASFLLVAYQETAQGPDEQASYPSVDRLKFPFRLAVCRLSRSESAASSSGAASYSVQLLSPDELSHLFPAVAKASQALRTVPLSAAYQGEKKTGWGGTQPKHLQQEVAPSALSSSAFVGGGSNPAENIYFELRSSAFAGSLDEFDKHYARYKPRDPSQPSLAKAIKAAKLQKGAGDEDRSDQEEEDKEEGEGAEGGRDQGKGPVAPAAKKAKADQAADGGKHLE